MVVLLIGGGSSLMDLMIDKMNKCGHRVYLLTGQKHNRFSYKRVFEKYNFAYDTDSVQNIFESVSPDLVVFLGAYDTNFDWRNAREESVRYTASIVNLLSAFSLMEKGRFVYLSSEEVYSVSHGENISELEEPSPKQFKALAISHGEELCSSYHSSQGLDTMVLRLDRLYGVPQKGQYLEDPCFHMCLEALRSGKISANANNSFSMLYLKDGVEMSYKAMTQENPAYACYNISSMDPINEMELAELVKKQMGSGIDILDNTIGDNYRVILDAGRYQSEYHTKIFTGYEGGVREVVRFMKRYSEVYITGEDVGGSWGSRLWHRIKTVARVLLPFAENLVFFIPFFMLNNRAVGSQYFSRLDFYLLYVLLFAIVHGQQQAIFSALLATAGYCFRQMYTRTSGEVLLDYNTYVWMAQLFILGMVVGYMKDQLAVIRNEYQEETRHLREKLADIEDINDSNVRVKQNFETQIMNQKDSLGKIYSITSTLEGYGPEEVLFYAAQVLSEVMNSKDVAVYTVANREYARLFSSTSQDARKLGNSIQYTAMTEMYDEVKEHRVYINKSMTEGLPLMASAIYADEEMQLILMLWGIPWQRMTLAEANRLTIVGHLIHDAVVRANRYLEALRNQRYIENTNILDESAFTQLVKAFFQARERGLTECSLLEVELTAGQTKEAAARALGALIRPTDYIGVFQNGRMHVLLSNTSMESAQWVVNRFLEKGYQSQTREEAAQCL